MSCVPNFCITRGIIWIFYFSPSQSGPFQWLPISPKFSKCIYWQDVVPNTLFCAWNTDRDRLRASAPVLLLLPLLLSLSLPEPGTYSVRLQKACFSLCLYSTNLLLILLVFDLTFIPLFSAAVSNLLLNPSIKVFSSALFLWDQFAFYFGVLDMGLQDIIPQSVFCEPWWDLGHWRASQSQK